MQVEFDGGVPAEARLSFAIGCFGAACREMFKHQEGRLSLASHSLALAFLIPMAAMLLLHAGGLGHSAYAYGVVDSARSQNPFLAVGQLAAAPALLLLWLILGAAHVRLAWVFLEKDWTRVFNVSAMIVAGTITLAIFIGVLFLHETRLALHAALTAIELTAVFAIAQRHGQSRAVSLLEELG
jgi:hypothetical protein